MFAEQMLGKYHLIAEIARGGMGVVYLALVQGPGGFSKLVVIKELKAELAEDPSFLTMFRDEARLAARLSHPNVVQTNGVGQEGDRHFMAMEYLDGRTFERIRRRAKHLGSSAFTLQMQLHVFCDVLGALEHAHKLADYDGTPLHVVHRDVSPNNVFITFDGQVKVLDFGIAKAADHHHETQAGAIKGKLSYMAPEQARGQKVDARADVFSVGVMLWEAVAGKRLRSGGADEIVKVAGGEEAPKLSTVVPDVPPELERIVAKAIANHREDRYASAAEFQQALEDYLMKFGTSTSARDLGNVLASLFQEERTKVNALIEQYITRARNGAAQDVDLPVIELSGGVSLQTPVGSTNAYISDSGQSASLVPSKGGENIESAGGSLPQPIRPVAPTGPARKWIIAAGAFALGGIAIAAFMFGRSGSHDKSPPAPIAATPIVAPPPAPAPAPAAAPMLPAPIDPTIEVAINAEPLDATITIDGALVSGNPFRGKYREDGVMHRIRVTAPNHDAVTRDVSFDRNVSLDLALPETPKATQAKGRRQVRSSSPPVQSRVAPEVKAPPPEVKPEVKPPPVEAKPDANQINPLGGQKPQRKIDSKNPYQ